MKATLGIGGCVLALLLHGCAAEEQWPAAFAESAYAEGLLTKTKKAEQFVPPPEVAAAFREQLAKLFGTPKEPTLPKATEAEARRLLAGAKLYRRQCQTCHGLNGDGKGPSAAGLLPPPRDYRRGLFKWKSSEYAAKPTAEDLARVIREGITDTSMPSFRALAEEDIQAIAAYVTFLATRGETEFNLLAAAAGEDGPRRDPEDKDGKAFAKDLAAYVKGAEKLAAKTAAAVAKSWASAKPVAVPEPPAHLVASAGPEWEKAVLKGRELYLSEKASCVKCHGRLADGQRGAVKADDPDNNDAWGHPIQPRNLSQGKYRGGRTAADLYRRVREGIRPSNMPGAKPTVLKPDEVWQLVAFIRALPYRPELLPGSPTVPAVARRP